MNELQYFFAHELIPIKQLRNEIIIYCMRKHVCHVNSNTIQMCSAMFFF